MPTRVLALCALGLTILSVTACQAAPPPPPSLSDADRTAIRQNDESFAKAANAKDFGTNASMYTDDGAILPPNGTAVIGRQQIQKWMSDFPPFSELTIEPVDVDGRGDVAYDRGNYSMTITPADGTPIHDRGKYVAIWRKQADGSWKMRWDMFNSDLAPGGR